MAAANRTDQQPNPQNRMKRRIYSVRAAASCCGDGPIPALIVERHDWTNPAYGIRDENLRRIREVVRPQRLLTGSACRALAQRRKTCASHDPADPAEPQIRRVQPPVAHDEHIARCRADQFPFGIQHQSFADALIAPFTLRQHLLEAVQMLQSRKYGLRLRRNSHQRARKPVGVWTGCGMQADESDLPVQSVAGR